MSDTSHNPVLYQLQVTYSPIEDDGTTMGTPSSGENIPPDQSSIQVTNLSINTGYRVSVVAATSAGTGTPAIQTGMTDEDGMIYHYPQTNLDPSLLKLVSCITCLQWGETELERALSR